MNQLQAEPLLTYDQQTGCWSGADTWVTVWMDDATLRAYAAAWVTWPRWLPDLPPAERQAAALRHCQRVAYWYGSERNYDPRVHLTYR